MDPHQGLSRISCLRCTLVASPIPYCCSNPSATTSTITPFLEVDNLPTSRLLNNFISSMHFGSFTNFLLFFKSKWDNLSNHPIPSSSQSKSHPPTSRLVNDFIFLMHFGSFTNLLFLLKSKSNNFSNHPIPQGKQSKSHPHTLNLANNFISSMHSHSFTNL